eukprot:269605_1
MEKNTFAKLSRFFCATVALFVGTCWIRSHLLKGGRQYRELEIRDSSKTSKNGESSLGYKLDTVVYPRRAKNSGLESNADYIYAKKCDGVNNPGKDLLAPAASEQIEAYSDDKSIDTNEIENDDDSTSSSSDNANPEEE